MIRRAEERGQIKPGDTLIEATSGNTGIALAMVAAMRGYRMILVMPEHLSVERRQSMAAFGAKFVLTAKEGGMEKARDVAEQMQANGDGLILDQFSNPDNPLSHYEGTAPEIWRDTQGQITHFVSSMGTTGTIMGCSRFFKEKNPAICDRRLPADRRIADSGHTQVARSLSAAHLRSQARGSGGRDCTTRRRGNDAAAGPRRGNLCRHFLRRSAVGGPADIRGSRKRHHRHDRL